MTDDVARRQKREAMALGSVQVVFQELRAIYSERRELSGFSLSQFPEVLSLDGETEITEKLSEGLRGPLPELGNALEQCAKAWNKAFKDEYGGPLDAGWLAALILQETIPALPVRDPDGGSNE